MRKKDPLILPENKLKAVIERHIEFVLYVCEGNKSRAAKVLGINRRSLQRKKK